MRYHTELTSWCVNRSHRMMCAVAFIVFLGSGMALMAAVPLVTPDNPQPLEGDLVLPMPAGREMVFRAVRLGVGDKPFASCEFTMGDSTGRFEREKPVKVRVGGSFVVDGNRGRDVAYYLGKYEVTEAQFAAPLNPAKANDSLLPQVNISRVDTDNFISAYNLWLSKNAAERLPHRGQIKGLVRLPTEQEWEFAARGGVVVRSELFLQACPWAGRSEEYEWFAGPTSSHGKLKPVGKLKPGPLGICDLLGNASELTDTRYELERGGGLVGGWTARGGDFRTPERDLRASFRIEVPERDPSGKPWTSDSVGFRLAIAAQVLTSDNVHDIAQQTSIITPLSEQLRELISSAGRCRLAGDTNGAFRILEKAGKLDPTNFEVTAELALAFEAANKPEKAREHWQRLLDPAAPYHYQELAKVKMVAISSEAGRAKIEEKNEERMQALQKAIDRQALETNEAKAKLAELQKQKSLPEKQDASFLPNQPHPIPQTDSADADRQSIQSFLKNWWAHNVSNNEADWVGDYANQVDYCYKEDGGRASRGFIMEDRRKLISRWPGRRYETLQDGNDFTIAADGSMATLRIKYRYFYSGGTRNASGISTTKLDLVRTASGWIITGFHESVDRK